MTKDEREALLQQAKLARQRSYSPYSGFAVGAALLLKSGEVILGCNIENASFGATNCAERTAIFQAVARGERDFVAIAVVGGRGEETEFCPPCGICLQVMTEFCDAKCFEVILETAEGESKAYRLEELLPAAFTSID